MSQKDFKERKGLGARKRDSDGIMEQYPDKVPLIIERFRNEKSLPILDRVKYLVPFDMTIGSLTSILRRRLQLGPSQSLFLLINEKNIACVSTLIGDLYRTDKDEDGFVYIVYASQEMFG